MLQYHKKAPNRRLARCRCHDKLQQQIMSLTSKSPVVYTKQQSAIAGLQVRQLNPLTRLITHNRRRMAPVASISWSTPACSTLGSVASSTAASPAAQVKSSAHSLHSRCNTWGRALHSSTACVCILYEVPDWQLILNLPDCCQIDELRICTDAGAKNALREVVTELCNACIAGFHCSMQPWSGRLGSEMDAQTWLTLALWLQSERRATEAELRTISSFELSRHTSARTAPEGPTRFVSHSLLCNAAYTCSRPFMAYPYLTISLEAVCKRRANCLLALWYTCKLESVQSLRMYFYQP